jgi:hypothetical protein
LPPPQKAALLQRLRAVRTPADLRPVEYCPDCTGPVPIVIREDGDPPPPDEPCAVCGRMRDPSVIRCIVIVKPPGAD